MPNKTINISATAMKGINDRKEQGQQERGATFLSLVLAVSTYLASFALQLWFTVFLLPKSLLPDLLSFVPTMDSAPRDPVTPRAVVCDIFLIALFGFWHSLLARPGIKRWMALPERYERTFYVIQSNICMALIMIYWRDFDGPTIWNFVTHGRTSNFFLGLYGFGFVFVTTASFAHDHFQLFGLSQGIGIDLNQAMGLAPSLSQPKSVPDVGSIKTGKQNVHAKNHAVTPPSLSTRWHYNLVAHPIMLGWFILFWSTPCMTMPHFLFSLGCTVYMIIAVLHFEEPDLAKVHGPAYTKYLDTVPRFIPFTKIA
ncbi:hypothetical protein ACA910_011970 [Epithemia clementina (nom. ined.)]